MMTTDDHPFVVVMRTWGFDDERSYGLVAAYLASHRTLSQRELEVLVLLDTGDVFKILTRWFGSELAVVARAHLVDAIKTNKLLLG